MSLREKLIKREEKKRRNDPKLNTPEHKQWLINCYETEIGEDRPFQNTVFTEAIRKLKESDLKCTQVEEWTEGVLRAWRTIPKK